ncbi:MAG: hypothetical protein WCL50_14095, partial [Spirochaetota bacterium]
AMTSGGLSLVVSRPDLIADLAPGQLLDECRLRVGKRILSLRCTVARPGNPLAMTFLEISPDQREFIDSYLASNR